jgi:nicotinamide-nucleotide amidase
MNTRTAIPTEIIAIGSELLTPYYQDTNSLYITQRLNDLGLSVQFKSIVGDSPKDLQSSIKNAFARARIIFATGGLGPTEDDQTREAFAEVLRKKLILNEAVLNKIEHRFQRRGYEMPSVNIKQAQVIQGAEILENEHGTAPGLWLETDGRTIILLPGPPHELKPMFEYFVWPRLQKYRTHHVERRVMKIVGLSESKIETLIHDLYPEDPSLQVTTLASPGQIEIHLTSHSLRSSEEAMTNLAALEKGLRSRLGENVFSSSGEELEAVVGKMLREKGKTLSVAESCTGGFLGHRITNIPGSSDYFIQGIQAYSNSAKNRLLQVDQGLLDRRGAVSAEVARVMAVNVKSISLASFGLAITGIAGPAGGSPEKPVGLVFTALSWTGGEEVARNLFLGNRQAVKFQSSQKALDMLRRHLLKLETG